MLTKKTESEIIFVFVYKIKYITNCQYIRIKEKPKDGLMSIREAVKRKERRRYKNKLIYQHNMGVEQAKYVHT